MTANASEMRSKLRPLRALIFVALACVLVPFTLWALASLYFDVRVPWLRTPFAKAYVVSLAAVWLSVKRRWLALGLSAGECVLVTAWWLSLQPSTDRDWQPDLFCTRRAYPTSKCEPRSDGAWKEIAGFAPALRLSIHAAR